MAVNLWNWHPITKWQFRTEEKGEIYDFLHFLCNWPFLKNLPKQITDVLYLCVVCSSRTKYTIWSVAESHRSNQKYQQVFSRFPKLPADDLQVYWKHSWIRKLFASLRTQLKTLHFFLTIAGGDLFRRLFLMLCECAFFHANESISVFFMTAPTVVKYELW